MCNHVIGKVDKKGWICLKCKEKFTEEYMQEVFKGFKPKEETC